jgi:hypothetical protein
MQQGLQRFLIIWWWVKFMVLVPSFTFQIELGNFEELVFIQLFDFCSHLKLLMYSIKNILHVFTPKELVHTFWIGHPIY